MCSIGVEGFDDGGVGVGRWKAGGDIVIQEGHMEGGFLSPGGNKPLVIVLAVTQWNKPSPATDSINCIVLMRLSNYFADSVKTGLEIWRIIELDAFIIFVFNKLRVKVTWARPPV